MKLGPPKEGDIKEVWPPISFFVFTFYHTNIVWDSHPSWGKKMGTPFGAQWISTKRTCMEIWGGGNKITKEPSQNGSSSPYSNPQTYQIETIWIPQTQQKRENSSGRGPRGYEGNYPRKNNLDGHEGGTGKGKEGGNLLAERGTTREEQELNHKTKRAWVDTDLLGTNCGKDNSPAYPGCRYRKGRKIPRGAPTSFLLQVPKHPTGKT